MGAVYKARHVMIGRQVAVKFLHSEYTDDDHVVTRFFREARAASAIGHKNIIEIFDVGVTDENTPYMVMEYLEGEPLNAAIERSGCMAPSAVFTLMEPVMSALSAAHKKGVVHRDLKPENIFIVSETEDAPATVKLIDFGISKFMNNNSDIRLTGAGTLVGTPAYMAPEQISNAMEIDHRADLYSVGVILFEMLTGRLPYDEETPHRLIAKILSEPLPPLSRLAPELSPALSCILSRALSRPPCTRYTDATEMLSDLREACTRTGHPTRLTDLTVGIVEKKCATGDLGEPKAVSTTKDIRGGAIPTPRPPWAAPSPVASIPAETIRATEFPLQGRVPLIIAGMLLSALATGVGAYFAFQTTPREPTVPALSPTRSVDTPPAATPPPKAASKPNIPAPASLDGPALPPLSLSEPNVPDTALSPVERGNGASGKHKPKAAGHSHHGADEKSEVEKLKFKQGKRGAQIVENFE